MQNAEMLQSTRFVTSSQSSVFVQNSRGPWPPEEGMERGERDNSRATKKEREIINHPNEVLCSMRRMTHFYYNMLLCVSPVGTRSLDGAVGERRGVGWGQQYIPEYMTRCSRSDRLSLGWWNQSTSTDVSTHWDQQALPKPTPPPIFPLSTQPSLHSKDLSPALITVQLTFLHCNEITNEC